MSLQIEHVSYRINGCLILDDVTATANRGEIIGLIGPNGAGKSTLANVLDGFTVPSSGTARLDDQGLIGVSTQRVSRTGVARTFQGQHLPWNSTSRACLISVLTSDPCRSTEHGKGGAENVAPRSDLGLQAEAYLSRFGLSEVSSTPVRDLSFGQQRLLAIAMACARCSTLLILDEPFTGLKSTALEGVLGVIRAEAQGKIVVVIDHTLSAVRAIASRIWFMHRGQLTPFCDYSELATSEMFRINYLGSQRTADQRSTRSDAPQQDGKEAQIEILCSPIVEGSSPVLAMNAVSAGYGNKTVLRQVDLEVHPGEIVCVIGLNGSGKSTLLRAIAGVARLFEGQVRICGQRVDLESSDTRVRMGVRILVQDHRLFRTLTLPDNLLLAAAAVESDDDHFGGLKLRPKKATLRSVAVQQRILESTVPHLTERAAGTYSGGEQSRVALAQIDFGNPKLILLDEPTSGIDGVAVQALITAIRGWQGRRIPIVIVEHALDFVASVATRVLVIANGELHLVPELQRQSNSELMRAILNRT